MTNADFPDDKLTRVSDTLDRMADLMLQSAQMQEDQHNRLITELRELRRVAEEQARTVRQFASIVGEQARTISEMTRLMRDAVEASQRSAQASEASAVIAQNNQNAIRDLIEELRQRGQA